MNESAEKLDARGLNCPLPILRTGKAIKSMAAGQMLEVTATDPGSVKDMEAFCLQSGNQLISSKKTNEAYVFLIEKS